MFHELQVFDVEGQMRRYFAEITFDFLEKLYISQCTVNRLAGAVEDGKG